MFPADVRKGCLFLNQDFSWSVNGRTPLSCTDSVQRGERSCSVQQRPWGKSWFWEVKSGGGSISSAALAHWRERCSLTEEAPRLEHDKPPTRRRPSLHQTGPHPWGPREGAPGSLGLAREPARGTWAPAARAGRSLKGAEGREKPRGQAGGLAGRGHPGAAEGDQVRGAHWPPDTQEAGSRGRPAG